MGRRGSWGRHDWPRSRETARLYRERCGAYILIYTDPELANPGHYAAVCNVLTGSDPSLGGTEVPRAYMASSKIHGRVSWDELPEKWQRAFIRYCDNPDDGDPFKPEEIRGLWRMDQLAARA